MDVDEENVQVMDGCKNDNGKLSNSYSYGTYLQVAFKVYKLRKLYTVLSIRSMFVCNSQYILHL